MRDGWTETALGNVCRLVKGATPTQKATPGIYPLVVTAEARGTSDTFQFDEAAVCVPMVSSTGHGHASLKRVHYQDGKFALANIITACLAREPSMLDMKFLWYVLDHGRDVLLVPRMKGTANVSLSQRALAEVPLSLPPIEEQRRVVNLVECFDVLVETARRAVAAMATLTNARLRALYCLEERESVGLEQLVTFASGSAFKISAQGDPSGTVPFLKVSDMNLAGNEVEILRANNLVTPEAMSELGARVWPNGTTIFPKVGAALLTEKRRILGVDAAFDNNVMGLVPKNGVDPWFVFGFMRTVRLGDLAQSGPLPSVNQGHLRGLMVPHVHAREQQAIVDEIRTLDAAMAAQRRYLESLRDLRSNVLTALLSGEHGIPESYDEVLEVVA